MEGDVMTTDNKTKPVVIVISEDAYKQNTVYRPWVETGTSSIAAVASAQPAQLQTIQYVLRVIAG